MSANNIKEMLKQGGINMKLVPLVDRVVLKQIVAEAVSYTHLSDQEQRSDQLFHVMPLLQDLVPDSAQVPG